MNEYETEEQQIEALKKWWKENGNSLMIGLLVGVSGLFGYRFYVNNQHVQAVTASDMYMTIVQNVASGAEIEQSIDLNNKLVNEFSSTPYASLSSMVLARSEYLKGNHDAAKAQLELALKYATDDIITQQIRFRLASLYIESGDFAQAETMLKAEHDEAYEAQYAIIRGDLYQAQGELDKARAEYDRAIALQGSAVSPWLRLKRDNVGVTVEQPAAVADPAGDA